MTRIRKRANRQPPITLAPLSFEDALRGLMKVKPEKRAQKKSGAKKKG